MTTETLVRDNLIAGGKAPTPGVATLAAGVGALVRGSALGRILRAIAAAVAGEGNTGNGTVTGVAMRAGVKIGSYLLTCTGGTLSAAKSDPVGTGTGALTLDVTTPVLAGAQAGVYKIVCIEPGSNAGTFGVYDPAGVYLGSYVVGAAAFATQIKFTIADATDFIAGDYFTVTLTAAVPANGLGTFSVTAPDGTVEGTATVGTAYTGTIGFTINDGATNFVVGDAFTIAVSETLGNYKLANSANTDGSEEVDCILAEAATATAATPVPVYLDGTFNENAITFGGSDTADTHRTAMRAKGMHLVTTTNV